ncbi:uroporphyrinogen-III synthase [Sphingosinithalassobacter portus]|uniref:uroporphyrinogen-III synthase n=1 Tax=Stakelama portus TaxID=2676234 RepID=UPI000D6DE2B9|nr:uroporphyrinogen-III synthase [Sphingosinithalassobacter portus]
MSRPLAVLRPEPGNAATAERIAALGRRAIRMPLFETRSMAWEIRDTERFDCLVFTSANGVRHAGPGAEALKHLPVLAVGSATAGAARAAGFAVAVTGTDDAAALIAEGERRGFRQALHLAGRNRRMTEGGIVARIATVYASDPLPITSDMAVQLINSVALVHSPRAAQRLAEIIEEARTNVALAAISAAAGEAAGSGWARVAIADAPTDASLIETACTLAD